MKILYDLDEFVNEYRTTFPVDSKKEGTIIAFGSMTFVSHNKQIKLDLDSKAVERIIDACENALQSSTKKETPR